MLYYILYYVLYYTTYTKVYYTKLYHTNEPCSRPGAAKRLPAAGWSNSQKVPTLHPCTDSQGFGFRVFRVSGLGSLGFRV